MKVFASLFISVFATIVAGCSATQNVPGAPSTLATVSNPRSAQSGISLATYTIYCSNIGLGTISAVVVSTSADDAFHVTGVSGGNGTVVPGDMLLVVAYTINGSSFSIPGYAKNGLTTYTCRFFSGRLQAFGTTTFVIEGT